MVGDRGRCLLALRIQPVIFDSEPSIPFGLKTYEMLHWALPARDWHMPGKIERV